MTDAQKDAYMIAVGKIEAYLEHSGDREAYEYVCTVVLAELTEELL